MKSTLFDTHTATKAALFGGEEGWYDAFWLDERADADSRHTTKDVCLLRNILASARIPFSVLHIHMSKILTVIGAAVVPLGFRLQGRWSQTKTE
jgi:hypothetical protein